MKEKLEIFLEQEYSKKISSGCHSIVYALSEKYVAKIYRISTKLSNITIPMERELEIAQKLYKNGISVPKPEGVFKVKINKPSTFFGFFLPYKKAFVMERIYGVPGHQTTGILREKVKKLQNLEIKKAKEKYLYYGESDLLQNCIYVPEKDKIYLIDFQDVPIPKIEEHYEDY